MKWLTLFPLILATAVFAAEKQNDDLTFLDPAKAGPDYRDQGEFKAGLFHHEGARVIALGNGEFRLVTYKGGLPGAGWDKKSRAELEGKRHGDTIVFHGANNAHAELEGRKLRITSDDGQFKMKKVVRKSPTLGAKPAKGAIVLFDGTNTDEWRDGHMDERHLLAAGCSTKKEFQDFHLHLEFFLPFKPFARGQARGNSGVYLQSRYEVQVLDSFGLTGEDNECGGIYKVANPAENMCFPPLTWQTYDIDFTAAKYEGGQRVKNAFVVVKHNGVMIQNTELKAHTAGNPKEDGPEPGALFLQGHGNPVFYRNIWIVTK